MMVGADNHKIGFFVATVVRCAERMNVMSLAVEKAVRQFKPCVAHLTAEVVFLFKRLYEVAVSENPANRGCGSTWQVLRLW